MRCPICKKQLEDNRTSCPYCGTPLKVVDGKYEKTSLMDSTDYTKTHTDRAHDEYIKKSRTIAGFLSLLSFPLMLGALAFFIVAFIDFTDINTGVITPGITYTPYAICFLAPSFIMAVIAFFKAKDNNFKSAQRIAIVEIVINGLLTIFGLIILVLYTSAVI